MGFTSPGKTGQAPNWLSRGRIKHMRCEFLLLSLWKKISQWKNQRITNGHSEVLIQMPVVISIHYLTPFVNTTSLIHLDNGWEITVQFLIKKKLYLFSIFPFILLKCFLIWSNSLWANMNVEWTQTAVLTLHLNLCVYTRREGPKVMNVQGTHASLGIKPPLLPGKILSTKQPDTAPFQLGQMTFRKGFKHIEHSISKHRICSVQSEIEFTISQDLTF